MIIKKYGIELHRLEHKDIELVRQMRNKESIRSKMFYQEVITEEMQEKWFKSIDNMYNYFFVIVYDGEKIGLINGKDVDFEARTCEGGIFIWDEKYWFTGIPVQASICLIELTFNIALLRKVYAHIREDNTISLYYNKLLGYEQVTSQGENTHVLTAENYSNKAEKIKNLVMKQSKEKPLTMEDITFPDIDEKLYLYKDLPEDVKETLRTKLPV